MMSLLSNSLLLSPSVLSAMALSGSPSPSSSMPSASVRPLHVVSLLPPYEGTFAGGLLKKNHRSRLQIVRMAPEEEKMTRRSPFDFPMEWDRPKPGRRSDIFPQFSPMKTPLPPPLPADPPEEDEEEEEENKEEEEENPEEGENPEKKDQ